MRYELTHYEWAAINPMLPNKPRGVPRVNDRCALNGIFWVLRSGAHCDQKEMAPTLWVRGSLVVPRLRQEILGVALCTPKSLLVSYEGRGRF